MLASHRRTHRTLAAICCLLPFASCWLPVDVVTPKRLAPRYGVRDGLTPRYGVRDGLSDSWCSGWGSEGDNQDETYDTDGSPTDEAVPNFYDVDEDAERAVALFASALDDDQLDDLQVRDVEEPARVIGLDGKPINDDDAVDDALAALNCEPDDDGCDPEDARSAGAEAALDLLSYDERERQDEADVDERLGVVMSHELMEVDADGDPVTTATRHVFVDEVTCIGCTSCATIAPLTFLMEDAFGRARSFNQEGDDDETVAEAIATCPVDCIHYLPWDELVALEREREGVMATYNFKGRLVGNEGLTSTAGAGSALLDISTNHAMRCQNCPTNKCPDCPMFAVSTDRRKTRCGNCPSNGCANCPIANKYPEFQKRRARRERKRKERVKAQKAEAAENLGLLRDGGAREL